MTGRKEPRRSSGIEYKHPDVDMAIRPESPAWSQAKSPRGAAIGPAMSTETPGPTTARPGIGKRKVGEGAVPTVKGRRRAPHSVVKRIASEPGPGTYARDTMFVDEKKPSPRRTSSMTR